MIQIIKGTQQQINRHMNSAQHSFDQPVILYTDKEFPAGFAGVRQLIDELAAYIDADELKSILNENKAIAAFVFSELEATLSQVEQDEFVFYSARLESRLSVAYGLFERLAALLNRILKNTVVEFLIPDLRTIDAESLRVFEFYYRNYPDCQQPIYIGFATDIVDVVDENGITWKRYQGDIQYFVGGFMQYETAKVILADDESITHELPVQVEFHPQPIAAEERLFNELMATSVVTNELADKIISLLNASYARYSFRAVMAIGLRLLEKKQTLSAQTISEVHGLIGSAANFYQFSHHANPPFDDFLAMHYTAALAHETRPEIRLALYYRLAFTYAERKSDIVSAEIWTDAFYQEVMNCSLPDKQRNYHLAWAYNVRGHVFAHTHRFDKAAEEAEIAYELLLAGIRELETEANPHLNYWLSDYRLSIFNLTIHQVYTGDEENEYEYSIRWHKRMSDIMSFMPRILLFDTFHWVDYHRNKLTIREALKSAEEGIADARFFKHGQIYVYTFCAADFNYRIGDMEKALSYFKQADALRPVYNDLFYFLSVPWFEANCYLQQNEFAKAEAVFTAELEKATSTDYQLLLQSKLVIIAAKDEHSAELEAKINTLIDAAVEYGEQNALIKAAVTAAQAMLCRGNTAAAEEAIGYAMELAATETTTDMPLNSANLFEMNITALNILGYQESIALNALTLLPDALNDIESWQHLSALHPYMMQLQESAVPELRNNKMIKNLNAFQTAFAQRKEVVELPLTHAG